MMAENPISTEDEPTNRLSVYLVMLGGVILLLVGSLFIVAVIGYQSILYMIGAAICLPVGLYVAHKHQLLFVLPIICFGWLGFIADAWTGHVFEYPYRTGTISEEAYRAIMVSNRTTVWTLVIVGVASILFSEYYRRKSIQ